MLAYFFDVVGYLVTSSLLDGFLSLASVCLVILIVRHFIFRGD